MHVPAILSAQVAIRAVPAVPAMPCSDACAHAVLTPCVIPHKEPAKAKIKVPYYQPVRFVLSARLSLWWHGLQIFTPVDAHQSRGADAAFKTAFRGLDGSTLFDKHLRRSVSRHLNRNHAQQAKQKSFHCSTSVGLRWEYTA